MAEPFQQHVAAALARRAAAETGALRERLDARLAAWQAMAGNVHATPAPAPAPQPGRHALAALLAQIEARRGQPQAAPARAALPSLRRTWSRLKADQRLAQSLATLPPNAGPLNSQHLVHRSLALMRELAPDYFESFIAHAETLMWLEQTQVPRKPPGQRRG